MVHRLSALRACARCFARQVVPAVHAQGAFAEAALSKAREVESSQNRSTASGNQSRLPEVVDELVRRVSSDLSRCAVVSEADRAARRRPPSNGLCVNRVPLRQAWPWHPPRQHAATESVGFAVRTNRRLRIFQLFAARYSTMSISPMMPMISPFSTTTATFFSSKILCTLDNGSSRQPR